MKSMSERMASLISEEGLDDFDALTIPREWDEVPLVSRLERIAFLSGMDVLEKSKILLVYAVKHLGRVLNFLARERRTDVLLMVSVVNWEDLAAADPDPVIPNFWISTDARRDLSTFRLRAGNTPEALLVKSWLASDAVAATYEVLDPAVPSLDPELQRVYVARYGDPQLRGLREPEPG